jgi:tRNA-2-methylthio-N6-dimethylallyladenosine synthase
MKFYVETFGCQMNLADSLEMGRRLKARGLKKTDDASEAHVILVNTCTVRQHAEDKALSYLGRLVPWKQGSLDRCLILAGCAAERLQSTIQRRFPHINVVVGAKSIAQFDELLDASLPRTFDGSQETMDAWGWMEGAHDIPTSEGATTHVTIMRGCNFSCSYCIVPSVRGREMYRPAASILSEVEAKAQQGQSEIILLGQTVNSYRPPMPNPGRSGHDVQDFADLLRAVAGVTGVRRIRYMSPHPHYVTPRFIDALAETAAVCPHLHLPVQSGSDLLLQRMRRNYTRGQYLEKVAALRQAVPGLALTTDFIVGYPGETDADFNATLRLAEEADFDGAYTFKYSPRPGTSSAEAPDDVPLAVKEDRLARLQAVTDALSRKKAAAAVGTDVDVLVEALRTTVEGEIREGRTATNRIIFVDHSSAAPGTYLRARVHRADGKTLYGTERRPV